MWLNITNCIIPIPIPIPIPIVTTQIMMIEPSKFDVIVVGTGLPEAILAAAIASSGRSVVHLDAYENYISPWASLTFSQFSSFITTGGCIPKPEFHEDEAEFKSSLSLSNLVAPVENSNPNPNPNSDVEGVVEEHDHEHEECAREVNVVDRAGLYSNVRVCMVDEEEASSSLGRVNRYHLDLAGPKVVFCAGQLVDVLLKAQADHHVRFKGVEASYIWRDNVMAIVPASRADIFRDRSLSLPDKRFLMRFFKLVTDYTESQDGMVAGLTADDLHSPFIELLKKQQLPSSIQEIILYAIAMADEDQEQIGDAANLMSAKDGFQALSLYLASASRFPDAPGPFLYPMYGHGDLPQAFCRCAAVHGALYVLRMPVTSLLVDKETMGCKGVRLASGQVLHSEKIITGPTVTWDNLLLSTSSLQSSEEQTEAETLRSSASEEVCTSSEATGRRTVSSKVARCVCISDQSLQPGLSTILVIFPPKSLNEGKQTVVRALQLGAATDVCPDGKYVIQLSTVCSDERAGEESLQAAIDALFHRDGTDQESSPESNKPKLLWCAFYIQEAFKASEVTSGLRICSMPDGKLDYGTMMTSAETIFREFFPDEEFLPRKAAPPSSDAEDGDAGEQNSTDI